MAAGNSFTFFGHVTFPCSLPYVPVPSAAKWVTQCCLECSALDGCECREWRSAVSQIFIGHLRNCHVVSSPNTLYHLISLLFFFLSIFGWLWGATYFLSLLRGLILKMHKMWGGGVEILRHSQEWRSVWTILWLKQIHASFKSRQKNSLRGFLVSNIMLPWAWPRNYTYIHTYFIA